MRTRVVHWHPNFLAGGGVANCVLALANAQGAAGADVTIVSELHENPLYGPMTPGRGVHISAWNGTGRPIGRRGIQLHLIGRTTVHALRAMQPDVVHAHGEFNPDNWWAPRLWDCPIILSPQGAFHPTVRARRPWEKRLYISFSGRVFYRHVTRFHALSPAESSDISAVLPIAQSYCVPQGPSPAVAETLTSLENAAGSHDGPVRIMFVGRIDVRTKGLDILLEAFALAVNERLLKRPTILMLIGPDWRNGKPYLTELARRLGIEHLVEIREPVSPAGVAQLVQCCDLYVQLSRNEGNPLSLNDALVLGKPAIVSDRVGTVSWNEIAGLRHVKVIKPSVSSAARAIAEAVADLAALKRIAQETHTDVRRFLSWDRAARLHLEEYASLLATAAQS